MMMKNYWVSWNHREDMGAFEYHGPWWVSGEGNGYKTLCAAVQRCEDASEVCAKIMRTYDTHPGELDVRFCDEKPDDWTPFSERFPRAEWMRWEP